MPPSFQDSIELIQRQHNPFDKAQLIYELLQQPGVTIHLVAKHLLVSPSSVSVLLSIRNVPESIKDAYYAKLITFTHVRLLARLGSSEEMLRVYEECLAQNLSSTQLEERILEILHGVVPMESEPANIMYARLIQAKLRMWQPDLDVSIKQTRIRTKITLELKSGRRQGNAFLKDLSDLLSDLK